MLPRRDPSYTRRMVAEDTAKSDTGSERLSLVVVSDFI
jgi:hypothetical protein